MSKAESLEKNNYEHIKFLLAKVKELAAGMAKLERDRDTDRAELKRLRELVEGGQSE